jgi:hypothetical protein
MKLRTLPDVVDRMVEFLMQENGCVTRITEGFGNGPEQMQATFPLADRIRNERHRYLNRVQVIIQSSIKSGSLIVRDYSGLPLDGSLVFDPDTPMPALCADLEDVKSWINAAWKDPARVKLFMAAFEPKQAAPETDKPKKPGRDRKGNVTDDELAADFGEVKKMYAGQGVVALMRKVKERHPNKYDVITPEALKTRLDRYESAKQNK